MLGNIGPMEMILIFAVLLLIFGPKRLPDLGSGIGKGIREFKSSLNQVSESVTNQVSESVTKIKD